MTELAPLLRDQRKVDADHLNLLSIFHFLAAGLAVLGICFLLAHFALMHSIFTNQKMWVGQRQQGPPPAQFIGALKWFYLIIGLWFLASLVLNLISGFCIRARKHRTFSLVVAGINCAHIPLGTVLGVFTIIILVRNSIRELYQVQ